MKTSWVFVALTLSGCASYKVADKVQPGSQRFFAGTALDVAAIKGDDATLAHYGAYGMTAPTHPHVDLPFSVAGDLLLFPFVLGYTIDEAILR